MKIQYCSDLHLEFPDNLKFLEDHPIKPSGDVLILAGDIVPFAFMEHYDTFFDYVADHFEMSWWIPGNHEYYYSDASNRSGAFMEKIRDNMILLNNQVVEYNDIRFLFATLWSKISPAHRWQVEQGMSDFHVINYQGRPLTSNQYNQFHNACLDFIQEELAKPFGGKTIVVTHHVPTFSNFPVQFIGSDLNEAFATELSELIEKAKPDYWIYGHLHGAIPSFTIGLTRLITNQLGYVKYHEKTAYGNDKFIIV